MKMVVATGLSFARILEQRAQLPTLLAARRGLYVRRLPPPDESKLPAVEPVENVEWKYVERLLPRRTVPPLTPKEHYPSGFVPQKGNPELSYSVRRSVNHMLPVYLRIRENGVKRLTMVRNVRGDIWAFHNDLKRHLEALTGSYVTSQVNEVTQYVVFKGEYITEVKEWLVGKGL